MLDICMDLPAEYSKFARAQDLIGWGRFMEGMVEVGCRQIQQAYLHLHSLHGSSKKWLQSLTTKLPKCTHGQWLYRNVVVHDRWRGSVANLRKEQILAEIEEQLAMDEDLLEEDEYLMEVNLDDLNNSSGTSQEYWFLAIKAARMAKQLLTSPPAGIG